MFAYCCSGITFSFDTDFENTKTFTLFSFLPFSSILYILFQFSMFTSQLELTVKKTEKRTKWNRFRWNTLKDESTNKIWFSRVCSCFVSFFLTLLVHSSFSSMNVFCTPNKRARSFFFCRSLYSIVSRLFLECGVFLCDAPSCTKVGRKQTLDAQWM